MNTCKLIIVLIALLGIASAGKLRAGEESATARNLATEVHTDSPPLKTVSGLIGSIANLEQVELFNMNMEMLGFTDEVILAAGGGQCDCCGCPGPCSQCTKRQRAICCTNSGYVGPDGDEHIDADLIAV